MKQQDLNDKKAGEILELIPEYDDFEYYLCSDEIIDFNADSISALGEKIKTESKDKIDYVKLSFEYVRDKIGHSGDMKGKTVTCKASDVLKYGEGICFAKSHLLCALLRYGGIPSGMCYQSLMFDHAHTPYLILHGLNGVYIEKIGRWIRLDARGNKKGVDAQFSLDEEKIAFHVKEEGEKDDPIVYAKPRQNVIDALTKYKTVSELWTNLPKP